MNRLDYKYELGELVQIRPICWRGIGRPIHFGFVIQRMKSFNSSYLYKIYWVNDETDDRWVREMDIKKYDDIKEIYKKCDEKILQDLWLEKNMNKRG